MPGSGSCPATPGEHCGAERPCGDGRRSRPETKQKKAPPKAGPRVMETTFGSLSSFRPRRLLPHSSHNGTINGANGVAAQVSGRQRKCPEAGRGHATRSGVPGVSSCQPWRHAGGGGTSLRTGRPRQGPGHPPRPAAHDQGPGSCATNTGGDADAPTAAGREGRAGSVAERISAERGNRRAGQSLKGITGRGTGRPGSSGPRSASTPKRLPPPCSVVLPRLPRRDSSVAVR